MSKGYEPIPRQSRLYRVTPMGITQRDDVSEKCREIYSNYFATILRRSRDIDFFENESIRASLGLISDIGYEDENDRSLRRSSADVNIALVNPSNLDIILDRFEEESEYIGLPLMKNFRGSDSREYKLGEYHISTSIVDRFEIVEPHGGQVCNKEFHMAFSRDRAEEHYLDLSDNVFTELKRFKNLVEASGQEWEEIEDMFYRIDYDKEFERCPETRTDLIDIPRDFWETSYESWKRMDRDFIEDSIDTFLDIYKESRENRDEGRSRSAIDSLDHLTGLLKTIDEEKE